MHCSGTCCAHQSDPFFEKDFEESNRNVLDSGIIILFDGRLVHAGPIRLLVDRPLRATVFFFFSVDEIAVDPSSQLFSFLDWYASERYAAALSRT